MKISIHPWCCLLVALAWASALLLGCGSTGPSVGGTGADAGPWASRPANSTGATPAHADAPRGPLTVIVRAIAAKEQTIVLNLDKVELNYDKDKWVTVATGATSQKLQEQPLRAGEKGASALLAHSQVDRRKFTAVRLSFSKAKSAIEEGKTVIPLTVDTATVKFAEWTPDAKEPNTLTLFVDGTKVTKTAASARLAAGAISAKTGIPAGGLIGSITPMVPATQVEVLWGATKVSLGRSVPLAPEGVFTIANLPPGEYQLKVTADGYHLAQPLEKPIVIDDKLVTLEKLELVKEEQ